MPDAFTPYCSTFEVHHIPLQPHAAAMSKRRCKHVLHSALQDEVQPPTGRQSIVRALGSRGGNHVEVRCLQPEWQGRFIITGVKQLTLCSTSG